MLPPVAAAASLLQLRHRLGLRRQRLASTTSSSTAQVQAHLWLYTQEQQQQQAMFGTYATLHPLLLLLQVVEALAASYP
jgi:hypothetical protein